MWGGRSPIHRVNFPATRTTVRLCDWSPGGSSCCAERVQLLSLITIATTSAPPASSALLLFLLPRWWRWGQSLRSSPLPRTAVCPLLASASPGLPTLPSFLPFVIHAAEAFSLEKGREGREGRVRWVAGRVDRGALQRDALTQVRERGS